MDLKIKCDRNILFFWNNALWYNWHMFQNPDGIAVHGISRAKAIDGILSNTYPLSSVVKYAHRTDIIYYKIIVDLTNKYIDLPDTKYGC